MKIPDAVVHRIIIWYNKSDAGLAGIQLFDKEGINLIETSSAAHVRDPEVYGNSETILQEDERIIGFKSRNNN